MQLRDILKTLDVDLELDDEAIITDLVVVGKVQRINGTPTVIKVKTEGTDHITATGLISVAYHQYAEGWQDVKGDGE